MHAGTTAGQREHGGPGAQVVGSALELLGPDGFEALHDVRSPGRPPAEIDHVVVGPPGVFVVHTESWAGAVTVEAQTLRQNGYTRVQQTEAVHRSALVVGLSLGASWAAFVVPVICLTGTAELVPTQAGPVTVLSVNHLSAWLLSQPGRLSPVDVQQVMRSLRVALPGEAVIALPGQGSGRIRLPKSQRRAPVPIERRAVQRREG
jgi:hypothetical protein